MVTARVTLGFGLGFGSHVRGWALCTRTSLRSLNSFNSFNGLDSFDCVDGLFIGKALGKDQRKDTQNN